MKCKCSLDNDYEVIGLCDIQEFNKKVNQFKNDKSWTQITLIQKLKISHEKAGIKELKSLLRNYQKFMITTNGLVPQITKL